MSSFNESEQGRKCCTGQGAANAEFMVLDPIELIEARSLIVNHTSNELEIPEDIAVRLLRRFGWETKRATEIWKSDQQSCCSLIGLPDGINSDINIERDMFCETCGIRQRVLYSPGCQHFTCSKCMQQYVSSKVMSAQSKRFCLDVRCPHKGCEYALQKGLIDAVSTEDVMDKLQDLELQSFVDDNPCTVRCPAKRCDNVIWCQGMDLNCSKGLNVTCSCGMSFCFNCRREAHAPLKCKTVREIQQRVDSKGGYNRQLLNRMKPCPKCRKLASRKNMENDIRCRSCGYRFCGLCLGMWDNQYQDLENTIEFYHHCKFQTRSDQSKDPRRGTHTSPIQKFRCQLMEQFGTHDKGVQLALMKIVQFRIKLVANEQQNQHAQDEWRLFSDSWHQAVSTHILLKWTYLLASYLCDQEDQGDETIGGGGGGVQQQQQLQQSQSLLSGVPRKFLPIEKLINDVEKELSELHSLLEKGLLHLEIQLENSGLGEFPESTLNACDDGAVTGGRMMATRFGLYQLTKQMWAAVTRIVRFEFEHSELTSNGERGTSVTSLQQNWYNYAGSENESMYPPPQPQSSTLESSVSNLYAQQSTNFDRYYLNQDRQQSLGQFETSSSGGSTTNTNTRGQYSLYAGRQTRQKQEQQLIQNSNFSVDYSVLSKYRSVDSIASPARMDLDKVRLEMDQKGGRGFSYQQRIIDNQQLKQQQNINIDNQQQQNYQQRDLLYQQEIGSMWSPQKNQARGVFKNQCLQGGWA